MLTLLEHPVSSYVQKVKIALREKQVPFVAEAVPGLGSGSASDDFRAANPRVEVPVLVDGPVRIFDSTVIMEYIEDRWPDPPLLPRDPAARAFARITEDVCDTQYEAVNWGFAEIAWYKRASGDLADTMKAEAVRQTAVLQAWLAGRLGDAPWFGGATFGWADAAAAPMVNRSVYYGLGPVAGTPLARWHARLCERPSVAATFAEFAAAAARMGDAASAFASGARRREYRDHRLEWMVKSGGIDIVLAGLRQQHPLSLARPGGRAGRNVERPSARTPLCRSRYSAALRLSRSENALRNFATFGATTNWQYPEYGLRVK